MRNPNYSKFIEAAALTGVTAAAFLGRVGVKPALAAPETKSPTTTELINGVITHPPGVKVLVGEAADKEMRTALQHLHLRWEGGVVVLHKPKKKAIVSYATSPSSYAFEPGNLSVGYNLIDKKVIFPNPALYISPLTHHLIAIGEDAQSGHWGACDLTYADSVGATAYYQIKGKHAHVAEYPFTTQEEQPPYILDSLDYEPDWYGPLGRETLVSLYLPEYSDPQKKLYQVQPVKAPHVK
jgi:hypothetical protein